MFHRSPAKSRSGFTLIELLVVIAIIAILAAILFPVFAHVKKMGLKTQCGSNLQQLAKAFFMYCNDNNGRVPRLCRVSLSGVENWANTGQYNWYQRATSGVFLDLNSYVKNDQIWLCPGPVCNLCFDSSGTRYEIDYRFNDRMNLSDGQPVRTKKMDSCTHPSSFYIVSDRHSRHHYERNANRQNEWVMLMVMADGRLVSNVKPYSPEWSDSRGTLKYAHWDFPFCHQMDRFVTSEY